MSKNATTAQAKPLWTRLSPEQIACACLDESHDDLRQAKALAGKRARGAKLRMVVRALGDAHWRAARG
jgi:hypothetical protein